jgi:hypothetical protein
MDNAHLIAKNSVQLGANGMLLDRRSLPLKGDTEGGGIMAGNACHTLIGDFEATRHKPRV